MATCDLEFTVFKKDTTSAPKCHDAWTKYRTGGYVCFVDVYSDTTGRIKYKLPLSLVSKYLNVTQGTIYILETSQYKFTLECILVFKGIAGSEAIKVKTCYEPTATPTPSPTPTPIPSGNISCITNPTGAGVQIDYLTFWKTTNCLVPNVPIGYHTVSYILSGYQDYTTSIYLSNNETKTVSAILIKLEDKGSIECTCNVEANITINGTNPQTTPYTYTGLKENTYYTIRFDKPNYTGASHTVLVKGASTAHANLTYRPTFGFDININIPGLTSSMNKKLWVEPVTKIPFTDTWIPSSVHGGIQWEWVTNRTYIAKDSSSKCDPQPNKYFTGSTNKLKTNTNYAIFVGDVILETFPGKLVHKTGSTTPTIVNLTDDYYDFLSEKVCGFIGVSPSGCKNWFGALLVDLVSPIADLYTIVYHKSLYTGESESPTSLTYFCAALGCIPGGGVIKQAGKLKYTDELADLAAIAKQNSKIYDALDNGQFIYKFDSLSSNDIGMILSAALRGDHNYIINLLKSRTAKLEYNTLENTLLNIAEITGDTASYRTMARAMDISEDGLKSLRMIKGGSTGQLLLTSGHADDAIHLWAESPHEFRKVIDNCTEIEINGTIVKCKQSQQTPLKVMGSLLDDSNLVVREFKTAPYETVESCLDKLSKSAERAKNYPNGDILYEEVINGAVHSVKKMEPILDDVMNLNSTDELSKVVTKAANNPISSWRNVVSNKNSLLLKDVLTKTIQNPLAKIIPATGISIAALWYINENAEDLLGIEATSRNVDSPSNISWQLKDKMALVDVAYWNVHNAEQAQNWTAFCNALTVYENAIKDYDSFGESHRTQLQSEGTYTTFRSYVESFNLAIQLKKQVHSCGLPSEFTATIDGYKDGDSIYLKYNNTRMECRLLGINSPESKGYTYSCNGTQQDYLVRRLTVFGGACVNETTWHANKELYDQSKTALAQAVPLYSTVTVRIDPNNETDKYGRKLVVLIKSGSNINVSMLRSGLAVVFFYSYNSKVNTSEYLAAELTAKNANTGVWKYAEGTGSILCNSKDKTACKIWLDGIDTGEKTVSSEFLLTNVLIGSHTIKFTKTVSGKNYECSETVTVLKDQTVNASCTLTIPGITPTPTPTPTGTIYCKSDNATGCEIWMDDEYTGHNTSSAGIYLLKNVPIGSRTITFIKYISGVKYSCNDTVTVRKDSQTHAHCSLNVPAPTPTPTPSCPNPTASFVMSPSSPKNRDIISLNAFDSSGGTNYFIEKYEWTLNQNLLGFGIYYSFQITPGNHILTLKVTNNCGKEDYKSKSFTVSTSPSPTPTQKTGSIYCESQNKTACTIWMDDIYTGHKTSSNVYLLKDVPIGTHTITFKKTESSGFYECSITVIVYENLQATAKCILHKLAIFPINFVSYPTGAQVTKQ